MSNLNDLNSKCLKSLSTLRLFNLNDNGFWHWLHGLECSDFGKRNKKLHSQCFDLILLVLFRSVCAC